jgi:hypothetical protein
LGSGRVGVVLLVVLMLVLVVEGEICGAANVRAATPVFFF